MPAADGSSRLPVTGTGAVVAVSVNVGPFTSVGLDGPVSRDLKPQTPAAPSASSPTNPAAMPTPSQLRRGCDFGGGRGVGGAGRGRSVDFALSGKGLRIVSACDVMPIARKKSTAISRLDV